MPPKPKSPLPSPFIKGYFSDRFLAGERPNYGYPASPLPVVPKDFVMEVETGFVTALKMKQKKKEAQK